MLYQLHITITEDDYIAFSMFQNFETKYGKNQLTMSRAFFGLIFLCVLAATVLIVGWHILTRPILLVPILLMALYWLFFERLARRGLKRQIQRQKTAGKLPFDPDATFEFYEDHMVEITPSSRAELSYDKIERICVVQDRALYLFDSSLTAFVLPLPQVREQLDPEELLDFLSEKCDTIEHYGA